MGFESLLISLLSLVGGIALGLLFNYLLFLILLKLMHFSGGFVYTIAPRAIKETVVVFALLFVAIMVYNRVKLWTTRPLDMLEESQKGETEPGSSVIVTGLGLICLAGGTPLRW